MAGASECPSNFDFSPSGGEPMKETSTPGLEICPYDRNHVVKIAKLESHISKCRETYREKKYLENNVVMHLCCKWNPCHEIIAPELLFHEARCPDKDKIIEIQNQKRIGRLENFIGEFEQFEWHDTQDPYNTKDLFPDTFIGSEGYGTPIPFEDIKPGGHLLRSYVPRPQPPPQRSSRDSSSASSASSSASIVSSSSTIGSFDTEGDSDEEYWNQNTNHPPFDYMENVQNPTRPILKFPPGLTRSQRRKFVEWNTQWRENIISNQSEPPAAQIPSFAPAPSCRLITRPPQQEEESLPDEHFVPFNSTSSIASDISLHETGHRLSRLAAFNRESRFHDTYSTSGNSSSTASVTSSAASVSSAAEDGDEDDDDTDSTLSDFQL